MSQAGWNKTSLLALFNFELSEVDRIPYFDQLHIFYTSPEGFMEILEPWWHDLQEYVRLGLNPIPPLPPGWEESVSSVGTTTYLHPSSSEIAQERPRGSFFSNLQSKQARNAYKLGEISLVTKIPPDSPNCPLETYDCKWLRFECECSVKNSETHVSECSAQRAWRAYKRAGCPLSWRTRQTFDIEDEEEEQESDEDQEELEGEGQFQDALDALEGFHLEPL